MLHVIGREVDHQSGLLAEPRVKALWCAVAVVFSLEIPSGKFTGEGADCDFEASSVSVATFSVRSCEGDLNVLVTDVGSLNITFTELGIVNGSVSIEVEEGSKLVRASFPKLQYADNIFIKVQNVVQDGVLFPSLVSVGDVDVKVKKTALFPALEDGRGLVLGRSDGTKLHSVQSMNLELHDVSFRFLTTSIL